MRTYLANSIPPCPGFQATLRGAPGVDFAMYEESRPDALRVVGGCIMEGNFLKLGEMPGGRFRGNCRQAPANPRRRTHLYAHRLHM